VDVATILPLLEHAWVLLLGAFGYMFREITSLKEKSATQEDLEALSKDFQASQMHIATNLVTRQELKEVLNEIARTNERMIEKQDAAQKLLMVEIKDFHNHLLTLYSKLSN